MNQGDSKVEDPSQGLVRMRSEAPTLASDVGNLVQIHQGEHEAIEHGQHLRHLRPAHAAPILAQGGIAAPVEPIFHGPMRPDHLRQPLGSAALLRQRRPAIDHLAAVLVTAAALAFDPKDLSHQRVPGRRGCWAYCL